MNNIRHFYALNDKIGYAVSSTNNQENFYLYTVFIDHNLQQIVVDNRITTYIANGHVVSFLIFLIINLITKFRYFGVHADIMILE